LTFFKSKRKKYSSEREYEVRAKEALTRSLPSLVPSVRRAWAGAKPQPEDWAGIGRIAPPVWRSRRSLVGHPQAEAEGQVALSKKPADTGTGDLFASPARPGLPQEYKAALESEGITHPKAQTGAAMADLGASPQDAFDFFSGLLPQK
jgi:hypothetical protein